MIKTIKRISSKVIYEAVILIVLGVIASGIKVSGSDYYFSFFLFDYSHGYMTRGFIGEVISLFTDTVTEQLAYRVVFAVFSLLAVAAALLLGRAIRKCDKQFKGTVIFISAALVLSPMTFRWLRLNGMQSDLYFYTCTMLALLFVKNKYLRWIIPFFGIIASLASVTYTVHCMILLAIVLLYEFSKEKRKSDGLLCLLTYAGIIGVAIYAIASRNSLSFSNADELYAYISSKTPCVLDEEAVRYYLGEYFLDLPEAIDKYIGVEIRSHWNTLIFGIFFVYLPIAVLFGVFWWKCLKKSKLPLSKFVFFLAIAEMLYACAPAIFTGEPGRWLAPALVVECGLLLYMVADHNEVVCDTLSSWLNGAKNRFFLTGFLIAYYSTLLFVNA